MLFRESYDLQEKLNELFGKRIVQAEPLKFQTLPYHFTANQLLKLIQSEDEGTRNQLLSEFGDLELSRLFSFIRTNLFSWLPFNENDSVLIVGAEAGVFAERISEYTKRVYCVETTAFSALLAAGRTRKRKNVKVIYGTLESASEVLQGKSFHYILFTDNQVVNKSLPIEMSDTVKNVRLAKTYLKPKGRVLFAADNALGVKFWSGCRDDISGDFFTGIENYASRSNTVGLPDPSDIQGIISQSQFQNSLVYYPYPDFWFPTSIYSDEYLPQKNELSKNAFSWEDRITLFNEVNVWNNIIKNEMFTKMTNSFLVVLSDADILSEKMNVFTKFSNDRSPLFCIRTDIFLDDEKKPHVKKVGLTEEGQEHLDKMRGWEEKLTEIYHDRNIEINHIINTEDGLEFEFLHGTPLLEKLNTSLDHDDFEGFLTNFRLLSDILNEKATHEFEVTPEFKKIFGDVKLPKGLKCCDVNNVDLIVQNVILTEKNLTIIDYEWTFDFPIPLNFIIYRSIVFFFRGPRGSFNYNKLYQTKLFELYEIDEAQCELFSEMEANFQQYICGSYHPLREIGLIHPKSIRPRSPQIYIDYGKGFSNQNSYCVSEELNGSNVIQFRIGLNDTVRRVRIDPSNQPCIVRVYTLTCGGREVYSPERKTNGVELYDNAYVFNTYDSQIVLPNLHPNTMYVDICMEITDIDEQISEAICSKLGKKK